MTLDSGIAVALLSLCLTKSGGLQRSRLRDSAIRGALLTDLTFAARLRSDDDGLTIDTTTTGFEPADRLLAAIVLEPDHNLEWWLRRGPVGQYDVAETLVAAGRWTHRPRQVLRPGAHYHDHTDSTGLRERLLAVVAGQPCDPHNAALACLAQRSGLLGDDHNRQSEELIAQCREAAWIVTAVADYLTAAALDALNGGHVSGTPGIGPS